MSSSQCVFNSPIVLYQLINGESKKRGSSTDVLIFQQPDLASMVQITSQPGNEVVLSTDVNSILNSQYTTASSTVYFDIFYNKRLFNFSMVFSSAMMMNAFIDNIIRCKFEATAQRRIAQDDLPDLNRYKLYMSNDKQATPARPDEQVFAADEYAQKGNPSDGKNILLQVAPHIQKSIVIRHYATHSDLGLFDLNSDCTFRQSLQSIHGQSMTPLDIYDMLNTNNDRSLLLLDKSSQSAITDLDMERGEVVRTYSAKDSNGVEYPVKKLLSCKGDSDATEFLAFNDRDTMMFDPRDSTGLINKSAYKTKNKFTSGSTTRSGRLAMGSADGVVRLYSGPCKTRATVNFQVNVGADPIIAIDISPDETWVVATCPFYLAVFNVRAPSTGKLAFDSPMGKEKPPLTRLALEQKHQQKIADAFGGELPSFAAAKFDVKGGRIASIVAGVGTALVSWDFRKIEEGSKPSYQITFIGGEAIIDDQPFITNDDVLFISDNQVSAVKRVRGRK